MTIHFLLAVNIWNMKYCSYHAVVNPPLNGIVSNVTDPRLTQCANDIRPLSSGIKSLLKKWNYTVKNIFSVEVWSAGVT